jgi:hypothetical protein
MYAVLVRRSEVEQVQRAAQSRSSAADGTLTSAPTTAE